MCRQSELFLARTVLLICWNLVIIECASYWSGRQRPYRHDYSVDQSDEKPLLENCGNNRGVCIQSEACPWSRLVTAQGADCLHQVNAVCCQVAKARMPLDMFEAY